ncbi:MAG: hypothetical protein GYB41_05525 [Oceanospirillales bacterium]|nr:hypothetical protein [Oceanospirillales bacterium]
MDDYLPSWITLAGFIAPAVILILKENTRDLATISYLLVIAGLCMLGGLLFSALLIYLIPTITHPLLSATLVLVGALLGLSLRTACQRLLNPD